VRAPIITPDDRRVDKDAELAMRMQEEMDIEHNSRRAISNPPAYVEENVSESVLARNAGVYHSRLNLHVAISFLS
jgi:hypothetical protein